MLQDSGELQKKILCNLTATQWSGIGAMIRLWLVNASEAHNIKAQEVCG